ncbi:FG-GAP repeat domain-containing protein [Streptomyces sp. NPDC020983]|uniref:FG-GAP repeat domain-containing protein n=1 Tax=Streptomyces sp. NPDC020983 TaxID=3365106 RepID=UPI0037A5F5D7
MSITSTRPPTGRRGRLPVISTFTALAASVLVLGPAATAQADAGAPHRGIAVPRMEAAQPSAAAAPRTAGKLPGTAAAAPASGPDAPLYDVNGDGYADLLMRWSTGTVSEWRSFGLTVERNGDTEYLDILTPGEEISSAAGPEALSLTASGRLSLWDHTSFPQGTPLWTGTGWQAYNKVVAVGDVTGDGLGDLVARTPTGDLYFYRGTGNVADPFTARVQIGHGFGIYDQMVGAGDITGSGHGSLVARDLAGDLWYYEIDGNAATPMAARVQIGKGWNAYTQLIGFPGAHPGAHGGILARTPSDEVYSYEGDPGGSGLTQLTARQDTTGTDLPQGYETDHVRVAGMGGNPSWDKASLLAMTSAGDLYVYLPNGDSTLSARSLIGSGLQGARIVSSASLTDKGEVALMEVYNGTLYDDTVAGGANALATGFGDYNLVLGPGDLSGDGRSDLLARDSSGVLWLYPGKGDSTFGARVKVGSGWGAYNQITGNGDLTGDGIADIAARDSGGTLYLYRGTGTASAPFQARVAISTGWNAYTKLAAPGDLDSDGKADIVGVSTAGELYLFGATGSPSASATFRARVKIGNSGWYAYTWLQ